MWIPTEVAHVAGSYNFTTMSGYGGPRMQETDTTQNFPFGTIVRAYDGLLGLGEFIYLQGLAATVAGTAVTYNSLTGVTTLLVATANSNLPVAISMAPTTAGLFGWYQISGAANCVSVTAGAVGTAYQAAAGITSGVTANQKIAGAQIIVAASSTFTKTVITRNGSTEIQVSNLDGVFVGLPISGTGIPGGATVAAGYNNSPNGRNSSAGSATTLILSAAATADGTVTATFTRTNFLVMSGNRYSTQP